MGLVDGLSIAQGLTPESRKYATVILQLMISSLIPRMYAFSLLPLYHHSRTVSVDALQPPPPTSPPPTPPPPPPTPTTFRVSLSRRRSS
ncbi:hypothetical protein M0804_000536 [Polistes exclamans]|nr:hypothetical protein M0804_000536 [Polistes exclamans]